MIVNVPLPAYDHPNLRGRSMNALRYYTIIVNMKHRLKDDGNLGGKRR